MPINSIFSFVIRYRPNVRTFSGTSLGSTCKHANVTCPGGKTTYPVTCSLGCPQYYSIKGASTITCQTSGQWTSYASSYCRRNNDPPSQVTFCKNSCFKSTGYSNYCSFHKHVILKFKSQLMFAFFAAVNHISRPLRKQKFTPTGSNDHGLWLADFDPFCVFPCFKVCCLWS